MSESSAPISRFEERGQQQEEHVHGASCGHGHDDTAVNELYSPPLTETERAWQDIARAAYPGDRIAANMPDISKQSLNEMLGLSPNAQMAVPYTNLGKPNLPGAGRSTIDWDALSRGETVVISPINPLPNRPMTNLDFRRPGNLDVRPGGALEIPRLGGPDVRNGTGARLLDPVQDRNILSRVPDALYIGQKGTVTSTRNRSGESQEYWLAGDAARAFAKAQEMLAAKGKQIVVEGKNGAGRTVDTQTEIYNRSHGGRGFAAGKPTSSNHTRGNAMDVANYQDPDVKRALLAVGWRQGDSRGPIANDLHHFSFAGTPQSEGPRRPHRRR